MSSSSRIATSLLRNLTSKTFKSTLSISRITPRPSIINSSYRSTYRKAFPKSFHTTAITMGVHNIESKAAFTEALKNEIVVLDCFATWCGPCKVIAPKVVEFSNEYPSVHFIKLDVDEVADVAAELGIRAMPTFLVFKNGEKVDEVVGANPPALKAAIQKAVGA